MVVTSIGGGPTTKAAPFDADPLPELPELPELPQRLKVGEPCGAVACVLPVLVAALVTTLSFLPLLLFFLYSARRFRLERLRLFNCLDMEILRLK